MGGISDLLDSDMEDSQDVLNENSILSSEDDTISNTANQKGSLAKKTKKRHRVTMPKGKARVAKISPVPATKTVNKKPTGAKRKALEEHVNGQVPNGKLVEDDEEVQETQKPKPRGRTAKSKIAKTAAPSAKLLDGEEMEVDQTPLAARSSHAASKPAKSGPKVVKTTSNKNTKPVQQAAIPKSQHEPLIESDIEETEEPIEKVQPKTLSRSNSTVRQANTFRRRAGSASDTERGDPNLRRKLGDVTRKFENIDLRYRTLKDVGINEANANMEKLRKQCEATTQASNELIASLKRELGLQAPVVQEAKKLKKQMQVQEAETIQLRNTSTELATALTIAQNEIKALQAKLAAARSSSAAPEMSNARTPGSAIKNAPIRSNISNGEAAQAAQNAQLKEDLYSDLTGLIVRGVKRSEDGDSYDCIQTGRNGTLHFKLFVDAEDAKSTSFEETDFLYTPLLDVSRDRDMIELMPSYLTEEITFARQNAAKFYGRVLDTLTKRRTDE